MKNLEFDPTGYSWVERVLAPFYETATISLVESMDIAAIAGVLRVDWGARVQATVESLASSGEQFLSPGGVMLQEVGSKTLILDPDTDFDISTINPDVLAALSVNGRGVAATSSVVGESWLTLAKDGIILSNIRNSKVADDEDLVSPEVASLLSRALPDYDDDDFSPFALSLWLLEGLTGVDLEELFRRSWYWLART